MTRKFLALCLLSVSGAAAAQEFGFIRDDSLAGQPNYFSTSTSRVFIISRFDGIVAAVRHEDPAPPLVLNPAIFDAQDSLVDIEGDGVRLPAEQFSLLEARAPKPVTRQSPRTRTARSADRPR